MEGFDTEGFQEVKRRNKRSTESKPTIQAPSGSSECAYCQSRERKSLVWCPAVSKWFCNITSGKQKIKSHIVTHCAIHKERDIQVMINGTLIPIHCVVCNESNIFTLASTKESIFSIFCRKCRLSRQIKDAKPLVEENCIAEWLVSSPCYRNSEAMSMKEMRQIENSWRNDNFSLEPTNFDELPLDLSIRMGCRSSNYRRIMSLTTEVEEREEKIVKSSENVSDIAVEWVKGRSQVPVAKFYIPLDFGRQIRIGSKFLMKQSRSENNVTNFFQAEGTVIRSNNGLIHLTLHRGTEIPTATHFDISAIWDGIVHKRMFSAIERFCMEEDCMSKTCREIILGEINSCTGKSVQPQFCSKLPSPNRTQRQVISKAISQPFTLIQGPPGTGKTVTITNITYSLLHQDSKDKILICAPSNIAVDNLAEKIASTGVDVVRVSSRPMDTLLPSIKPLSLEYKVRNLKWSGSKTLQNLYKKVDNLEELTSDEEKEFHELRLEAESIILANSRVVCVTCSAAGGMTLARLRFPIVIIDECSQGREAECLIPITKGARKIVLVGDQKQLAPQMIDEFLRRGVISSLFERLIGFGVPIQKLDCQYRMHPFLNRFPSMKFYNNELQSETQEHERSSSAINWPNKKKPIIFFSVEEREEISASGLSFLNLGEASKVIDILKYLQQKSIDPNQIGVITPYSAQRFLLLELFRHDTALSDAIEINSVDGFQGREKDFIVFSCVSSNRTRGVGFVNCPRRMNVFLTRARRGIIMVGNIATLRKDDLWNDWFEFHKDCLYEGDFQEMTQFQYSS